MILLRSLISCHETPLRPANGRKYGLFFLSVVLGPRLLERPLCREQWAYFKHAFSCRNSQKALRRFFYTNTTLLFHGQSMEPHLLPANKIPEDPFSRECVCFYFRALSRAQLSGYGGTRIWKSNFRGVPTRIPTSGRASLWCAGKFRLFGFRGISSGFLEVFAFLATRHSTDASGSASTNGVDLCD